MSETFDKLLDTVQRPGAVVTVPPNLSLEELGKLNQLVVSGQKYGHAMVVDECIEAGSLFRVVRIFHYATCRACQEEAHDERQR